MYFNCVVKWKNHESLSAWIKRVYVPRVWNKTLLWNERNLTGGKGIFLNKWESSNVGDQNGLLVFNREI